MNSIRSTPASKEKTTIAIIGCGEMARHHLEVILDSGDADVIAVLEPSLENFARAGSLFSRYDHRLPPQYAELETLLDNHGPETDVALVASPHVFHHNQTVACMEAGLDVLLEKPMVLNAAEAISLIEARDRTDQLLVVAFPGSLSPAIRESARRIGTGEIGKLVGISATVWQNWATNTAQTWRQHFPYSGGGFLFDTGAHMLNTVVDLAGENFSEVSARFRSPVDSVEYSGVISGILESGALVTMHGCGETINSCASEIRVFGSKAILRTGVWGERLTEQKDGQDKEQAIRFKHPGNVWTQFQLVRRGRIANPSPPEVGLRMARLWDAIRSSAQAGAPVRLPSTAS